MAQLGAQEVLKNYIHTSTKVFCMFVCHTWPSFQGCRGLLCVKPCAQNLEKIIKARLCKICYRMPRHQMPLVLTFDDGDLHFQVTVSLYVWNLVDTIQTKWLNLCFSKFVIGCLRVTSRLCQLLAIVTFISRSQGVVMCKTYGHDS